MVIQASQQGYIDIVKYLLENGGDINDKNNQGSSCILLASCKSNLEMIKYFVNEKGLSLQEMDTKGTCIMAAARNYQYEYVLWMLSNGSSLDENTKLDEDGNIIECESCADIFKRQGKFDELKRIFETKSSKK